MENVDVKEVILKKEWNVLPIEQGMILLINVTQEHFLIVNLEDVLLVLLGVCHVKILFNAHLVQLASIYIPPPSFAQNIVEMGVDIFLIVMMVIVIMEMDVLLLVQFNLDIVVQEDLQTLQTIVFYIFPLSFLLLEQDKFAFNQK